MDRMANREAIHEQQRDRLEHPDEFIRPGIVPWFRIQAGKII